MADIRKHRVTAFCDWAETQLDSPPLHERPEFRFFCDLTSDEFGAAADELERRAARYFEEAEVSQEIAAMLATNGSASLAEWTEADDG